MEVESKIDAFKWELELIVSPNIREFAEWAIKQMPDYFFEVPASSSGKYHPKYALGKGGLLRHTIGAVRIAHTLLYTETFGDQYSSGQKDAILVALILHDAIKQGIEFPKHTVKNHPMLVRPYFEERLHKQADGYSCGLSERQRHGIWCLIESHMGQWTESGAGRKLPKPKTDAQKLVHLCDYLASRKSLEFNFDA